jgi:hypothetical protein
MFIRSFRQSASKMAALLVAASLTSSFAVAEPPLRRGSPVRDIAAPAESSGSLAWESKILASGYQFACMDDSKMLLAFQDTANGVDALIRVHGQNYRLPAQPPGTGEVRILWSDGANSLTWSPGVQLMWMSGSTHLMCGRSHNHNH